MSTNYFEVYLSKDGLSELFLFALKDLQQAENLIKSSYPDYKKSTKSNAHPPYIRITSLKKEEQDVEMFFVK